MNAAPDIADLMCGLEGTEYIGFHPRTDSRPGDRLRFIARQPAHASNYPFRDTSPVGPPVDVQANLLDATYTTSWATVVPAPNPRAGSISDSLRGPTQGRLASTGSTRTSISTSHRCTAPKIRAWCWTARIMLPARAQGRHYDSFGQAGGEERAVHCRADRKISRDKSSGRRGARQLVRAGKPFTRRKHACRARAWKELLPITRPLHPV